MRPVSSGGAAALSGTPPPSRRRLHRTTTLLLLCLTIAIEAAAARRLVDALRDLEKRGLKLVYSEDVVRPDMLVKSEPRENDPRKILDELLRPHDLRAVDGPRGTLLIVREEKQQQQQTPQIEMPITLAEITVTPSRFTILADVPESRHFLSRDEVRRLPHLADDVYRAIQRVPGTASDDLSARFHLRGGAQDEVQVLLDGAEIYDPFHVKDLARAFSIIDAEAVGAVDILSGGFPVEYGGRMSGVVDISTLTPEKTQTEAGVGLLHARVLAQGPSWLVSIRRGYLREVLELIDNTNEVDPRYYDLLAKAQWTLGGSAMLSAHALASHDKLRLNEFDGSNAEATYDDRYFWLNLRGAPTPRAFAQSVLSFATLERDRGGTYRNVPATQFGTLDERRRARILSWKNDATLDVSPRNVLKFGFTAKHSRARYDFDASAEIVGSPYQAGAPPRSIRRSAHVNPSGTELSAYVADRIRLGERVVAEGGLRMATESYTPDGTHFDPRISLSWFATPRTAVRAAWGVFHQADRIDELQVEDGVTEFAPAQKSVHRVLSIEHVLPRKAQARLELYDKSIANVRPRYENVFDRILLFPEIRDDRVRVAPASARARGAEVLVRSDAARPLSAWISYTLAEVTDEIDGRDVARAWDQRHAATFSVNYRRGDAWNFNVAGTWHTGWPTTPVNARLEGDRVVSTIGQRSSLRLPSYRRVDFRASRNFRRASFFVELFNVLNQNNVSRIDSFAYTIAADGTVTPIARTESILGIVPSFGVTYRW